MSSERNTAEERIVRPVWAESVDQCLSRYITSSDRFLAAVSGGADSIGLLAYLADVYGLRSERLVVGHVDHSIREDAWQDTEVSREAARQRKLGFVSKRKEAPAVARAQRLSIEAAARRVRYEALNEMADEFRCQWILTGHTLDDSAETVLMRMQSGAPWYEWTAIPRRRGRILRPLLSVRRGALREWTQYCGLAYCSDPSNADLRIARNQLRADLLQKQEFWSEERIARMAQAGEALGLGLQVLRAISGRMPGLRRVATGEIGLAIEVIFRYFSDLTFLPVESAWAELAERPEARLSSACRRQVTDLLRGTSPEAAIELPHGIRAIRRGGWLWLMRGENLEFCRKLTIGRNPVPERSGEITLDDGQPAISSVLWAMPIRREFAARELWFRNWRAGDRLKPQGRPTKKIAALLNERGLSPLAKSRALVVADEQGPLLIVGGEVAERALPDPADTQPMWIAWEGQNDDSNG